MTVQKWLVLPACSHVSQESDLLTSATKIKLSQPLPLINPASLPQEERTGFSLLCISRIIHQLGFMLTAGGAVGARESCLGSGCPWGVCMARCQKNSVFPVRDGGGNAALTAGNSSLLGLQSQLLSEPSFQQIIPAQGCLSSKGTALSAEQDLMHVGGLKKPLWPNSGLSLLCRPPQHTTGCPQPCTAVQDPECSDCCSHMLLTWVKAPNHLWEL